ncbi:hypothetical protein HJC23_001122 [Cyclotella cryptica]|uniref:Uncharacterized protein n=1 Tax=Cyclotella cryptica TaxID=29204 RepID=A0ABD3QL66_9STRA
MTTSSLPFLLSLFQILLKSPSISLAETKTTDKDTTTFSTNGITKAQGPPPFFLQDSTDLLCLHNEDFRCCSIDRVFFVVGSPGSYQIHKCPVD